MSVLLIFMAVGLYFFMSKNTVCDDLRDIEQLRSNENSINHNVNNAVDILNADDQVHAEKLDKHAYTHLSMDSMINGLEQKINILEVDLTESSIDVKPVLSFDLIYGFEYLSEIAQRKGASAAVNAGFFHEYGEPGGMVMVDGVLYTKPTRQYPVLIIDEDNARLEELSIDMKITYEDKSIKVHDINAAGNPGCVVVYTPVFGSDNRAKDENITAVVNHGVVIEVINTNSSTKIPKNGMLITYYPPYDKNSSIISEGQRVKFERSELSSVKQHAYECGSWLLRDGENVAPLWDSWVGVLSNRAPRTAVGIKDDSILVFITVDGRQPGYSYGVTAKELADIFISNGVTNAAMLDGGATTAMYVDGEIVNIPSHLGQERRMGGAFIIKYVED